ncbi:MAG: TetR/AcrR family transcriptional regulator [Rhodospirillales bacterium]|nr:TetR/AcrR family transcriptional regulator [Rhodospirillales bacterium]
MVAHMATKKTAPRAKSKSKTAPPPLSREDWLHAAKAALLKGGVDHVKVDRLARDIKMTRGSFYWHFTDRDDLLRALLDHWEATNTGPLLLAIEAAEKRGRDGFNEVTKVWIEEKEFSPAFDSAVRDWARKDAAVARAVRRIDEKRIAALTRLMNSFGFAPEEAVVRARVIYFHQVGYYALAIRESEAERHKLLPLYSKILVELDS